MLGTLGAFRDPKAIRDEGHVAFNVLRVASAIASAEQVVIGVDTYEIEIVNTDSTDVTQGGDFSNVTDPLTIVDFTTNYPNCPATVGSLVRIENEILVITGVDGADITFARGVSNTAAATHADALAVYEGDGITGDIAVGLVTTLTPAVFTDALIADINSRGTEFVKATDISDNEVLVCSADAVDGNCVANSTTYATTETMGGSNNAWDKSNIDGGSFPHAHVISIKTRVPTTQEVALGNMHFVYPFVIGTAMIEVIVTATGSPIGWNGSHTISGYALIVDNDGSTDWSTSDTVTVLVSD